MAFRFKREGHLIKHRKNFENSGMRKWIDEFKFEILDFHYQFWMGPQAQKALRSNQQGTEEIQFIMDSIASGKGSSKFTSPKKRFFFRNFIPQIIPFKKTTNPFCKVSSNKTGWTPFSLQGKKIKVPKCQAGHEVGGTNPQPPVFPKNV